MFIEIDLKMMYVSAVLVTDSDFEILNSFFFHFWANFWLAENKFELPVYVTLWHYVMWSILFSSRWIGQMKIFKILLNFWIKNHLNLFVPSQTCMLWHASTHMYEIQVDKSEQFVLFFSWRSPWIECKKK